MWPSRPALELWMELRCNKPGMVRKFNHLYQALVRSHPSDNQSGIHAPATEYIVDFIPVPMSLVNHFLSVRLVGRRTRIDLGRRRSQAHGTPMSSTSFCSGRRSMTGYGVVGSNSAELAPTIPITWRAKSTTATWSPR